MSILFYFFFSFYVGLQQLSQIRIFTNIFRTGSTTTRKYFTQSDSKHGYGVCSFSLIMADIITACPIMYIAIAKLRNSFYMLSHLDFSVTNLLYIHITRYSQELSAIVSTDAVICMLCQFVGHYNALPRSLYTILFNEERNRLVHSLYNLQK